MSNVIVIGAGAAGMMAAGTALKHGVRVCIIEKNEKPGRKLMITGKGRCNVTNDCNDLNRLIKNVPTNGRFLYSAFSSFMPADTMRLFESLGVPLKTERGKRVFPVSDKACDIVDALKAFCRDADFVHGTVKSLLAENGRIHSAVLEDGRVLSADAFILATGGKSYPLTGSTGDGYTIAAALGHSITPIHPSLVPLKCADNCCPLLQGLSLKNVKLSLFSASRKKALFEDCGEMLFTHFGVSGPLVLSASAYIRDFDQEKYFFLIDFKPGLDENALDARILRDFEKNSNKDFINALDALLPKKLIPVIVKMSGIEARRKVNQITRSERMALVQLLKHFRLEITSFWSIDQAVITSGGINVKEIEPKTMCSRLYENLYFAGEIIDVDAFTGGFNLQIAFSTGTAAGLAASR